MEKDLMNSAHMWNLKTWIDKRKLVKGGLSRNPNAIYFLEENPKMIDWNSLSSNGSAMHILLKIQKI